VHFTFVNGRFERLFAPDDGGSSGGSAPDVGATYKELLARHNNDAVSLAMSLLSDNFQWREKNRELRTEVTTLQGKLPGEGTRVLTPDEVKLWDQYVAHGTPDQVKAIIQDRDRLQVEVEKTGKETVIQQVAGLGWNVNGLRDLLGNSEIKLEEREVEGQKTKVAMVKDGDKFVELEGFAKQKWPHFYSVLRTESSDTGGEQGVAPENTGSSNDGVVWINQSSSQNGLAKGTTRDVVEGHINKTYHVPGKKPAAQEPHQ
jgi:hypothetical protein